MPFLALRFDADAANAERWSDALIEAGALSVDVADAAADAASEIPVYGEPGADSSRLWPTTRLTALFSVGFDVDRALAAAVAMVGESAPPHVVEEVPDADWVRASEAQFEPLRVTDDLWIVPSWREPVVPRAVNVRIDPGLAFGTGSHPSTRLCLRWLAAQLPRGARVLDYGCGSGILAIAAAKLSAGAVMGVDVDAQSVAVSRMNAEVNGVDATFGTPEELDTSTPFDVVVANILANPLERLAPRLAALVRERGAIVLSGILDSQAAALIGVYSRWFNIGIWAEEEGWVALAGTRSAD